MRAIGLSGYARAGKTTAARYIEEHYGFERRHIAEPLRAMLAVLLRANGYAHQEITRILEGDRKDGWIIPEFGCTSRHLQITLGTEWGREQVSPDIWAKTWANSVQPSERVMNDSVRFPNEEASIRRDLDGITILIRRPNCGPAQFRWGWLGKALFRIGIMAGVHDSERLDRLNPDIIIDNDGAEQDLFDKIDQVMKAHGVPRLALSRAA